MFRRDSDGTKINIRRNMGVRKDVAGMWEMLV